MRKKYSLAYHLLSEGKKKKGGSSIKAICKANTRTMEKRYGKGTYTRPCGYEVLIQDNIKAAGLGPGPTGNTSPDFCSGTSTGADCNMTSKKSKDPIQVEVKSGTGAPRVRTAVGAFGGYHSEHVFTSMVKVWNTWKTSAAHSTLWDTWIRASLDQSLFTDANRVTWAKKKLSFRTTPTSEQMIAQMVAECVDETIAVVDGQLSSQTASGLQFPYMVSAPENSVACMGVPSFSLYEGTSMTAADSCASFVGEKYSAIPYIQIESKGFFRVGESDPMGFGALVPKATFSCNPTVIGWGRGGSPDSRFTFSNGVSVPKVSYYIAESGGTNTTSTSPTSLHNPGDCAKLAAIAKKNGVI